MLQPVNSSGKSVTCYSQLPTQHIYIMVYTENLLALQCSLLDEFRCCFSLVPNYDTCIQVSVNKRRIEPLLFTCCMILSCRVRDKVFLSHFLLLICFKNQYRNEISSKTSLFLCIQLEKYKKMLKLDRKEKILKSIRSSLMQRSCMMSPLYYTSLI